MEQVAWTIIKYYGWQCPDCDEWNETHEGKLMDDQRRTNLVVVCERCDKPFKLDQ